MSETMDHQRYFEKVELLKVLIERKRANTMSAISKKLNVSARTVQLMINSAAQNGTHIAYCPNAKTYSICSN